MEASDAIRAMVKASDKSGRQVSREIGRADSFVSAMLAQGVCPRVSTLARIANACGFELVAIPKGALDTLDDDLHPILIEYDGS